MKYSIHKQMSQDWELKVFIGKDEKEKLIKIKNFIESFGGEHIK